MESHIGGPIIIKKYTEISPEYKKAMEKYKMDMANNMNTSKKPDVYEEKFISQSYTLTSITIMPMKANISLFSNI